MSCRTDVCSQVCQSALTGSSFARKAETSAHSALWERTAEKKDLKCVDQAEPGRKKDEKKTERKKGLVSIKKERKLTMMMIVMMIVMMMMMMMMMWWWWSFPQV